MTILDRIALCRDETGAVFAEFAILLPVIVLLLGGSIDFLYAFYQWNAAVKAVEVGARIAAVSDPVALGLNEFSNQAVLNGAVPGTTMPAFTVTCQDDSCSCLGACAGLVQNSFNEKAMDRIVFGRGLNKKACGHQKSYYMTGMCDLLPAISRENVVVVYKQTGLGYAGRPGGPLPTIQVSLTGMQFRFFFLNSFFGVHVAMPTITITITAEDLCSRVGGTTCGS
jgi:hypothetical protein